MNRHAVFFLAFNQNKEQHDLTFQALESVFVQDIGPLDILLIDNGSTYADSVSFFRGLKDDHIFSHRIQVVRYKENTSPLIVCNRALPYIWSLGHDKVLSVPNDVILPPNLYSEFNKWPRGVVTGSMSGEKDVAKINRWNSSVVSECTPMAVGLIRKWVYDALIAKDGYFLDEKFFFYASDCDFALRMAGCGIHGVQLDLPYFHYGSAHWRMLPPEEGQKATDQADRDREYFQQKWLFRVDDPTYSNIAVDLQFKGEV
jgi:hypothetical protein